MLTEKTAQQPEDYLEAMLIYKSKTHKAEARARAHTKRERNIQYI
jgi:hypothetical protein